MPAESRLQDNKALRAVYCQNKRRCGNGRPIGKAVLGAGSAASFSCPICHVKTVVVGVTSPHWG